METYIGDNLIKQKEGFSLPMRDGNPAIRGRRLGPESFSLPMRDGNSDPAYAGANLLGFSLPMRDGNCIRTE